MSTCCAAKRRRKMAKFDKRRAKSKARSKVFKGHMAGGRA